MDAAIMSGMDGMGMDMSTDPLFRTYNQELARGYWYIIVAVLAAILFIRAIDFYQTWSRKRICRTRKNIRYPTRVNSWPMQIFATSTAVFRELSYPQLYFSGFFSGLTPPSLGRVLVLSIYWSIISYLMFHDSVIHDAYYWERIGFRGAWVSVTQVPFIYLLSSKSSIIGHIIGSSHERLNWLHRWASRTLLFTVTIHGFFFMAEWIRADFVTLELEMMPMVKYGLGAWGILVWTFLSSLSPMRRIAYEFFVLQHIVCAIILLWVLYMHVPDYARYNIWFAIVAISFDWVLRFCLLILTNFRFRVKKTCNGTQRIGHSTRLEAIGSDLTIITIKDVHLSWRAGQHLYLWLPRLGPLESHPFTIATPYKVDDGCHCNEIQLAVRAHAGFSKRIHDYAMKNGPEVSLLTSFIAGPYGAPPRWESFETLLLISASTGASYTLPILESILSSTTTICTQRIRFLLIVRDRPHCGYYEARLSKALTQAEALGIEMEAEIAITGDACSLKDSETAAEQEVKEEHRIQSTEGKLEHLGHKETETIVSVKSARSSSTDSSLQMGEKELGCCNTSSCCCTSASPETSRSIIYSFSRPNIAEFIRTPIELTGGETSVAVCGGKSLVATVRNSVTSFSDERAVHKGTGAQGIHLHVEEYCF